MVDAGAPNILIGLSKTQDVNTQSQCATALAFLSEITVVEGGMASSMRKMTINTEANRVVDEESTSKQLQRPTETSGLMKDRNARASIDADSFHFQDAPQTGRASRASFETPSSGQKSRSSFDKNNDDFSSQASTQHFPEVVETVDTPVAFSISSSSSGMGYPATLAKYSSQHLEEEVALVAFDFTPFVYTVTVGEVSIAPGGMAKALKLEQVLPRIQVDEKKDAPTRNDELIPIPVDKAPLPLESFQSDVHLLENIFTKEAASAAASTGQSTRTTPETSVSSSPVVATKKVFESASVNRAEVNKKKSKKGNRSQSSVNMSF